MGDFVLLIDGDPVSLPPAEQRLLAFLACVGHPVSRNHVIGELWPDAEPAHAHGRLRSSLWRIRRSGSRAIRSVGHGLRLDPAVRCDLHSGTRLAHRVSDEDGRLPRDSAMHLWLLGRDLLVHWFDDWLEPYRDHYHQLRVQALEHAGRRLLADGRPGPAAVLAREAVAAEPLRDSAHWMLLRALAAEGNHSKAVEHYRGYVEMMRTELGVRVPRSLSEILRASDEMSPAGLYENVANGSRRTRTL